MFWRILLLTYFATGAAWGPAFCCCRVGQAIEAGLALIHTPIPQAAKTEVVGGNAAANGTCPRCRAAAAKSLISEYRSTACCNPSAEPLGSDSDCPCQERGERGVGLWAFAFSDQQLQRLELLNELVLVGIATDDGSNRAEAPAHSHRRDLVGKPPFLLFGRALLCAHQTLNC